MFLKIQLCMKNQSPEQRLGRVDIDTAFASYLVHVAKCFGMAYYVRTLKFVLLYREYFIAYFSGRKNLPGQN